MIFRIEIGVSQIEGTIGMSKKLAGWERVIRSPAQDSVPKIKPYSESKFILFYSEEGCSANGGIGLGRRIGFKPEALARIAVLQDAWSQLRERMYELREKSPAAALTYGLFTTEFLLDEGSKRIYYTKVIIQDNDLVLVHRIEGTGMMLGINLKKTWQDEVTFIRYPRTRLELGELILRGDERFVKNEDSMFGDYISIPEEWIGKPFSTDLHPKVVRPVPPKLIYHTDLPTRTRFRPRSIGTSFSYQEQP